MVFKNIYNIYTKSKDNIIFLEVKNSIILNTNYSKYNQIYNDI
jgi:hypothetical protein